MSQWEMRTFIKKGIDTIQISLERREYYKHLFKKKFIIVRK